MPAAEHAVVSPLATDHEMRFKVKLSIRRVGSVEQRGGYGARTGESMKPNELWLPVPFVTRTLGKVEWMDVFESLRQR